jgi:hypothetical protein
VRDLRDDLYTLYTSGHVYEFGSIRCWRLADSHRLPLITQNIAFGNSPAYLRYNSLVEDWGCTLLRKTKATTFGSTSKREGIIGIRKQDILGSVPPLYW